MELFAEQVLTPDGWLNNVSLTIEGGCFTSFAADTIPAPNAERHAILLPAISNLHSHAFQRAMAGRTERRGASSDSFWTWREEMYRFALSMSPDDVEAVATLLYIEMLEAGFCRVGEFHYLHHAPDGSAYANLAEMAERIASASSNSGIGLTLLPVFYAHSSFGGAAPNTGQRRFINDLDQFERLLNQSAQTLNQLAHANIGIAPHSLRAVTPDELAALVAMVGEQPFHIHISEQLKEVEDCVSWSGARPVEWLLSHADVQQNWCLIHATHMTDAEYRGVAKSGAVVGLCPLTESNLGDGIFDGERFMNQGGPFGVGSDSNVQIGLADELRQLEYSQRLGFKSRNVLAQPNGSTGRALYDAALKGGHQALGQSAGGITVGSQADFVSLDKNQSALFEMSGDYILDAWIFSGQRCVDCVWVAGKKLVANGRHNLRDEATARYRRVMKKLNS
jgi:formimidoylglutamate deiminase